MGNGKQIEVGHILKKVRQPNPNSKSYQLEEDKSRKYQDQSQIKEKTETAIKHKKFNKD